MTKPDLEIDAARRIAVISCVHGNLPALEAVLEDIHEQGVDDVVCLGDLVGYGPEPNEVCARIQEIEIEVVQGCWDEGIARDSGHCGCTFTNEEEQRLGEQTYAWTQAEVTRATRDYLAAAPFGTRIRGAGGTLVFVHGSPRSRSEYLLPSTHDLILLERIAAAECDVLVCGHTHVPFVRHLSGTLRVMAEASLDGSAGSAGAAPGRSIELAPKLIVNAGSVGEPRHGGREATYVVLDTHTLRVEIHRVGYDMDETLARMKRKGVPDRIAERLSLGAELVEKNKGIACAC